MSLCRSWCYSSPPPNNAISFAGQLVFIEDPQEFTWLHRSRWFGPTLDDWQEYRGIRKSVKYRTIALVIPWLFAVYYSTVFLGGSNMWLSVQSALGCTLLPQYPLFLTIRLGPKNNSHRVIKNKTQHLLFRVTHSVYNRCGSVKCTSGKVFMKPAHGVWALVLFLIIAPRYLVMGRHHIGLSVFASCPCIPRLHISSSRIYLVSRNLFLLAN